ncbi:hypothetical protein L914_15461 [Phytophthora nicotianae]|uniref:Uncharacterized protein n=1 Tax=Phytophthora nicotianae TaxID=4792 RepID=W2MPD3_PHYNI|nr:hypothetical protein L914_15461 [Phytophthora nicotianae]
MRLLQLTTADALTLCSTMLRLKLAIVLLSQS